MMKKYTKLFAILLSALLVMGIIIPFVMAEGETLPGQKELFVKNVTTPPVQDGILNGHKLNGETVDEYGTGGPTFCLTPEDYRALDLEGKPLDVELPSYIYLYMAKDADALYVGMEIQEKAHAGDLYEFTTFLGFGDKTDADTMNSGAFTTFKMDNGNSARNDPGTWMDTQVTALSAQKVAADGTVTDTTADRKFNVPFEYTLPSWASETKNGTNPVTFFEAELDFEDAMLGSGLDADADVPDYAYFAFELGVFNGTEKIGKIVFNNDMTGKADAPDGAIKTVPHLINLKTEFNAGTANNADLSVLSVEGGTLSPAFNKNTTEYTLTLPNGTTSVNITATPEAEETVVTVDGADEIDGISAGGKEAITVTCVAQNGYTKVYTLFISWAYDSSDYYVDSATGNDYSGNGSEATPYATIDKAMAAIAEKEWELSDMVTIHINGTFNATAPDGVLFGAKTVFTKGATKLPITIKGDSKTADVINLPSGNVACANDYVFQTLSLPAIKARTVKFYAGSGNVELNDVSFGGTMSTNAPVIFGDTFTAKVFEGWTETQIAKIKSQNERGNIATSISFGKGSDYLSSSTSTQTAAAAVGDSGGWDNASITTVTPLDTEPTVINNGATIYKLSGAGVTNPNEVALIRVVMNDGHGYLYTADGASGATTFKSNVSIEMYGGAMDYDGSSMLPASQNASTYEKNLTVTMEGGTAAYLQVGYNNPTVKGDAILNVGGTANVTKIATGGSSNVQGRIINNIYGNPTIASFQGAFYNVAVQNDKVETYVSGGKITDFFGINNNKAGANIGEVYNEISGGIITNFYGTSTAYATTAGTVHNKISGTANITNFYGNGKNASNVATTVTNDILGGTFTSFYGSNSGKITTLNNNFSGGTFIGTKDADTSGNDSGLEMLNGSFSTTITTQNNFYTGGTLGGIAGENRSTVTNMNNTIDGATIERFFGTYQGTATNVHNVIKSGTFNKTFDGSYRSTTKSVVTDVTDGEFKSAFYPSWARYATIDSAICNISGGTFNGTIHMGGYGGAYGSVENNISGGTFRNATVYLGAGSTTWPSAVNGNVTNNVTGGDFTNATAVYGGGMCSLVKGNIVNNIKGGTFKVFYGGNYRCYYNSSADKLVAGTEYTNKSVLGKVINNFGVEGAATGPVFNSYVFGGDLGNSQATNDYTSIENNVYSGTFNTTFYGGSDTDLVKQTGNITNTIKGGTFKGNFFGGSHSSSTTGKIVNKISGGTFEAAPTALSTSNNKFDKAVFLGSRIGSVSAIENTITGGTFKALVLGGGGPESTTGNITNTISGGTFTYTCTGAGFGNVTGNVTATLKGDANFKQGFFAIHPAKYTVSSVSGNVITTVTKDESGNAPIFGRALGMEFAITDIFSGSYNLAHTNLGLGTGAYAMVNGYVETTIEAGTFNGHYYASGYFAEISGKNADGYSVITHVTGTPEFNYNYAGSAITTYKLAGGIYNDIQGGKFDYDFNCAGRSGFCNEPNATYIWDVPVDTVIGGNAEVNCSIMAFNGPWSTDQSKNSILSAPVTLTINGGTFNGNIYGFHNRSDGAGNPILMDGASIAINIHGGTFNGEIFAPSLRSAMSFASVANGVTATVTIAPTVSDVVFTTDLKALHSIDRIVLAGGEYKLIMGADASIEATSATGNVKIGQSSAWKKQTYVTMPEGNDAVVTVTGTHTFDRIGNSVVAVKGGVQLSAATMILTDRVAVRALFDKASVDNNADFTFSFMMNGQVLAEGNKADLTEYNEDYYCIVLAKIGASDFTSDVTFSGSDMVWARTFSIKGLAELAETAWAGNDVDVQLAKAMQNFATIVADPNAELDYDLEPEKVEYTPTASRDDNTSFVVTGKGLIMSNAVGIRIYGTSSTAVTADSFTIQVNGTDVTSKAVVSAGDNANEYTIDLYVNAKNMSDELTIVITEKATEKVCLNLTDRVDAIAASYPDTHENYYLARQLLVYIQAAVAYASK